MSVKDNDAHRNNNDLFLSAKRLVEHGIPIVLLKENHHPPEGLQQKIAANPKYYTEDIDRLRKDIEYYKIKHISVLFGLAGIMDESGRSLILHGLDTDGKIFDNDERKKKIIEDLKTKTMVVKTRKKWGNLMLWFEHSRHHKSIKTADCIDQFHCFELKCQNNARADVPPSTHRNDESFYYSHVGLDKIAILDGLYDKLVDEDLRDCILFERHPYGSTELQGDAESKTYGKLFYSLSEETISALIPLAGKYYIEGNHDKFTFQFSGMMWHASIDIESAIDIITKICQRAGDTEKLQKRIETIKETYARGNKGLTIAGTTEFIKLVQHLSGCTTEEAENVIRRIKIVWRVDAPGPELKQPIIIGSSWSKNKNKRKGSTKKNYANDYSDSDSSNDLNFRSPGSAEILLRLAEKKILLLFANQFDECYACILVPDRMMLICYDKEGFKVDINSSNAHANNLSADNITNSFAQGSHLENVPIFSQKFKEYLMQIYREDSELQEERAEWAEKEIRNQLLQDEVKKNLWKQANENNSDKDEKNEEELIILHGKIVGSEAIKNVQMLLAYSARTKTPKLPTYKRVAPEFDESSFYLNGEAGSVEVRLSQQTQQLSKIYYALYDNQNRIIEITKTEWIIRSSIENIIFNNNDNKQYSTQKQPYSLLPLFIRNSEIPQVEPSRTYPNNIFATFMKLVNVKNEDEKLLVEVYILSLFIPEIPHYMLIPYGTYGAAKSFLFKLIKLLVDPDKPLLLTLPKEKEQFVQQLSHSLVLYYDNIETVPSWFNAEVCSAVTGGGHRKRRLFTDDDDFVYEYMRCLGFNGINVALTKPDSLSRSILIEMAEIDKHSREEERYLFSKLGQIKSQLLGYIMDILVKVLNIYPTVRLAKKVRMADYAVWGEALSQALGNKPGKYAEILEANQNRQHVTAVLATPLGSFMIKFAKIELLDKGKVEWKGQPDDLMEFLTQMIDDKRLRVDKRELPGQTHKLVSELNIIRPNLRDGYGIRFENNHRPESGLSEISIKIDKETFEKAVNYPNEDNNDNKSSTSNNGTANNNDKSKNQSTGSSSEKVEDKTQEEEAPESNNQYLEEMEPATKDNDNNYNNDWIKNKFGLGTGAEAWDNSSYPDQEEEEEGEG